jgi:PRTRC genetic system ThiF family protein
MTEPKKITFDKTYGFVLHPDARISNIVVLGAGGTGSHVIPDLARLLADQKTKGIAQPRMVIIDGDSIETKNLARQNFISADVGKNKAEVMANRYAAAFGLVVEHLPKYVESVEELSEICKLHYRHVTVIFSCVDNVKSRDLIRKLKGLGEVVWIDCGNEESSGQVVFSNMTMNWNSDSTFIPSGTFPVPTVFDLYANLEDVLKTDKFVSEQSCAEFAESAPQHGFVNKTAATLALNYFFDLIKRNPIVTHGVEFSIKNRFSFKNITKSVIEDWVAKGWVSGQI